MPEQWHSLDSFLEGTGHDTPIQDSERYVSYSLNDLYPKWQDKAHCAGVGVDYYFGDEDKQPSMPERIAQVRRASKLCDVCPVFSECLTHALENREEYGVWAGTSGRARKKLFSRLDKGESLEDIIKAVLNEREQRGRQPASPFRGSGDVQAGDRLPDEATGIVAL